MPVYNSWKVTMWGTGQFNLLGETLKVALLTSSYTPDIDAHDYFDDLTNEVSDPGYSAGGATLGGKTLTLDTTDDEAVLDATDLTWASSSITARFAVLYRNTGTPATSDLIGYWDFGSDKVSSNGDFTLQWNTEGVLNHT